MNTARTYTLDRPGLLPTMGGGYAVVADDSPLGYPRIGDVEKADPRWHGRPMVGRDSWHRTRKAAVDAVVEAVREVNAASEQAERDEAPAVRRAASLADALEARDRAEYGPRLAGESVAAWVRRSA